MLRPLDVFLLAFFFCCFSLAFGLFSVSHQKHIHASVTFGLKFSIIPTIFPDLNRSPGAWNPGAATKSCYGETVPTSGTTYPGIYPDQMQVVQEVINEMNTPTFLLDITTLSAMRKDAHPSIYSGDLSPEQRANPDHSADCSHWCLPGLPDTWNQLFYTVLFF